MIQSLVIGCGFVQQTDFLLGKQLADEEIAILLVDCFMNVG